MNKEPTKRDRVKRLEEALESAKNRLRVAESNRRNPEILHRSIADAERSIAIQQQRIDVARASLANLDSDYETALSNVERIGRKLRLEKDTELRKLQKLQQEAKRLMAELGLSQEQLDALAEEQRQAKQ